jgi:hypothetical protein
MSKSRHRKLCVCPVDVARLNRVALAHSRELISALLPGGVTSGPQYVVPLPADRRVLSIFLDSGKWSDFAIVAHGDDLIGFVAHDHLRLGMIAECTDRAAACAQRAVNAARRRNKRALAVMLRQMRMCAVAIDACEELGERRDDLAAPKPDFGSTEKEGKYDQ